MTIAPDVPDQVRFLLRGAEFTGEDQLREIGPPAVDTLLEVLRDEAEGELIRVRAAKVLADMRVDAAAETLLELLSSESTVLRCGAAHALALLASPGLRVDYRSRLSDDEICVRVAMARALATVGFSRPDLDALLQVAARERSRTALAAQRAAVLEIQRTPLRGQITGQVVTASGVGLSGITVTLTTDGSGAATTTDANGSYRFGDLSQGAYVVTVSGFDSDLTFEEASIPVKLGEGEEAVQDFVAR